MRVMEGKNKLGKGSHWATLIRYRARSHLDFHKCFSSGGRVLERSRSLKLFERLKCRIDIEDSHAEKSQFVAPTRSIVISLTF